MVRIITDSSAYLTLDEQLANGIAVVPLSITLDGITEKEGPPGTFSSFFERLQASKNFPTTSQPSVGDWLSHYEELQREGEEVVVLTLASSLSGTFEGALLASRDFSGVSVVDSGNLGPALRDMVLAAAGMARSGQARESIVNWLEEVKRKYTLYVGLNTVEFLKRGGRVSGAQALVGELLQIKPILKLKDNLLSPVAKVRTRIKMMAGLIERVPEKCRIVSVAHIQDHLAAMELAKMIREKFNLNVIMEEIGPLLGAHAGPGAVAICVFEE